MPQVKLISDGTAGGTRVYDMQGNEIVGFSRVSFNCRDRGATKIYLEFDQAAVDVVGIGPHTIPEGATQK